MPAMPMALRGWAIPAATDIAFALGIVMLLGSRVPASLKVFLTAVAIIDDLGAIVVIAVFYTADLSLSVLGLAAVGIVCLFILNRVGVRRADVYIVVGLAIWVCVLKSGIHATLAGVVTALAIPMEDRDGAPLAGALEHGLHPWVAFAGAADVRLRQCRRIADGAFAGQPARRDTARHRRRSGRSARRSASSGRPGS